MVAYELASLVVTICLLPLSFVWLYIGYMEYPGLFAKMGIGRGETGLLLIGAWVGVVANFPIIVYEGSMLALNLGGALIPVVLGYHLGRVAVGNCCNKGFLLAAIVVGIFLTSVTSILATTYDPSIGIYAVFPDYLAPPLVAAVFALAIFRRNVILGAPVAYVAGSIGTLIGADIVRIPQIFGTASSEGETFMGSIGGAGAMDMVFLSGLIAMGLVMLVATREQARIPKRLPRHRRLLRESGLEIHNAEKALANKQYPEVIQHSVAGLERHIESKAALLHWNHHGQDFLARLYIEWYKLNDYHLLKQVAQKGAENVTWNDAVNAYNAANKLIADIDARIANILAPISKRAVAFIIDFVVIVLVFVGVIVTLSLSYPDSLSEANMVWVMALLMWAWVANLVYYTLTEGIWGKSLGKMALRIKVVREDYTPCGLMPAFTRNVVRFLDIILLFYLGSLLMMATTEKRQRIGDYIGETIVINY
jgi:uncharacterized membrane protein